MPSFMLKKIVLGNFSSGPVDSVMADAIDFMVDRVRMVAPGGDTLGWRFLVCLVPEDTSVSLSRY